jgi:hypothetical protein
MSSKNNVNPDHYKVGGRLRPGEDLVPEMEKRKARAAQGRGRKPKAPRTTARKRPAKTGPDTAASTPARDSTE